MAFDRVARLAREFECDARSTLLRLSMERQGILVKSSIIAEQTSSTASFGNRGIAAGGASLSEVHLPHAGELGSDATLESEHLLSL